MEVPRRGLGYNAAEPVNRDQALGMARGLDTAVEVSSVTSGSKVLERAAGLQNGIL